jgi:peptidoglycan/xylan/chitin deacetylase (PgdA/CDA1 family)
VIRERKAFFFEKKNQKTFTHWRTLPERRAPRVKSFLLLFFKKEDLPLTWPDHARLAVSLVVNIEEGSERSVARGDSGMEAVDELGMFVKGPVRNYANESNYLFGIKVGAPRILRLLAEHHFAATWTVCGMAMENAPDLARAITAQGHEPCSHGYRWQFQYKMDEATERDFIRRATEAIARTTGVRPLGWLSRYLPSDNTRRLLSEAGYHYHMDDFSGELPFWDGASGKPIVVVPYQIDTNDMKMWSDPAYTARAWLDYAVDSFDQLYGEGGEAPGMLSIGLHARIIGRPGRAHALARLLQHIASHKQVWVATRLAIAQHFAARSPYTAQ